MRTVPLFLALTVLAGCASAPREHNPYMTPADLAKVTATTAAELQEQLGTPNRRSENKKLDCKVWHYEAKAERPFFGPEGIVSYQFPTTLRSMDFCIDRDGAIIQRNVAGTYYVHFRPPVLANVILEVHQMSQKELEQPRIGPATKEDPAKVDAYYQGLQK